MQIIPELVPTVMLTLPFLVTFLALHFILFRPLLDYMAERQTIADTARRETEEFSARVGERTSALEDKLEKARGEVADLRAEARSRALSQQDAIIGDARKKAESKVAAAAKEIAAEKAKAQATLQAMTKELSGDVVAQVLGREVA